MFVTFRVVLSCVSTGLAMGRSPAQGVLLNCLKEFIIAEVNSKSEQAGGLICETCNNIYWHSDIQSRTNEDVRNIGQRVLNPSIRNMV